MCMTHLCTCIPITPPHIHVDMHPPTHMLIHTHTSTHMHPHISVWLCTCGDDVHVCTVCIGVWVLCMCVYMCILSTWTMYVAHTCTYLHMYMHMHIPLITLQSVWVEYVVSYKEAGVRAAQYSTFRQLTPQIQVMKPMSDLCWVCQQIVGPSWKQPTCQRSRNHR